MNKRPLSLMCLAAMGLFGLSTRALAESVTIRLVGASGPGYQGVIVGPYEGSIQGYAGHDLNSAKIICNSYADRVYEGAEWAAHVSTLNDLSRTEFGSSRLHDYEAALWLTEQMLGSDQSRWGAIHFAIWAIFSPIAKSFLSGFGGSDTQARFWYDLALSRNYNLSDFSHWRIVTPDDMTVLDPQEYFVYVPEPSSLVLLSVALAAMVLGWRKLDAGRVGRANKPSGQPVELPPD